MTAAETDEFLDDSWRQWEINLSIYSQEIQAKYPPPVPGSIVLAGHLEYCSLATRLLRPAN